jgi:transposase
MKPLTLKLHWKQVNIIKDIVEYEEPRVIKRANILNCLHLGYTSSQISKILNVNQKTVTNIAHIYLGDGLEAALHDDERNGRPVDFDDRARSRIIAMVCSDPPAGHYRWTLDLIVDESQKRELIEGTISKEEVRIILQEHDLKPWQEKMWCIGKLNDEYIERMEKILDIYSQPYNEKIPVVCVDEKPVPLMSDSRERIPAQEPGEILKKDYEYERDGSVNVFCAVEGKVGKYFNKVTDRRTGFDFAYFLEDIANAYGEAEKITLIMDNLSTHKFKSLEVCFGKEKAEILWNRFNVFYTPVHASWLNQAEIAIGIYSRQCLGDGRVGTVEKLRSQTTAWNQYANRKKFKIAWRFTKSKARKSFCYDRLDGQHSEKLI